MVLLQTSAAQAESNSQSVACAATGGYRAENVQRTAKKQPRSTAVCMLILRDQLNAIYASSSACLFKRFWMPRNMKKMHIRRTIISHEIKGCPKASGDRTRHHKAPSNRIRPHYSACAVCRRQDRLTIGWVISSWWSINT